MVKCAECGFLAAKIRVTNYLGPPYLAEVHESDRQEWFSSTHVIFEPWPVCFARVKEFRADVDEAPKYPYNPAGLRGVIQRERTCKKYTEWYQGFTPKEHQERLDRKWERKWRLLELGLLALMGGAFTALGAWIASL